MNGNQWRKKRFSVTMNCSKEAYDRIFGSKSKCCNVAVKVEGLPDFVGDKQPCTVHNVCTKCKKSCDIRSKNGKK